MAQFRVSKIIDGDTFEVAEGWKWNGKFGSRVRPTGYNAPELHTAAGLLAKQKLTKLIQGEIVSFGDAYRIDHGRLVCDVYYNGRDLADYFGEYQ